VTVLFSTHPAYLEHLAGPRHPERPERLQAVVEGIHWAGVDEAVERLLPVAAERADLERVHPVHYLDRIERLCLAGGGRLDPDTYAGPESWSAGTLAAGAGLTAVRAMQQGQGDVAFCAVRPPGHHATRVESMGFCFINNVAVVAASLADAGERVLVFDFDAHHGNGTQAVFEDDPRVLFVSMHQWPLYPGSGRADELGNGAAWGTTLNVPLPPGTTGDVYLRAFDTLLAPVIDRFAPTFVVISAGFDAHRDDPITQLGLAAGDYPALVARALSLVPAGRRLLMLEGGYDLDALMFSVGAVMQGLLDVPSTLPSDERATSGGAGAHAVDDIGQLWRELGVL
jgi:acetoin utilization deacetylase AcuC-like enzyme